MSATATALSRIRSVAATAESFALSRKAALPGVMDIGGGMGGLQQLNQFREQSANRERYALFRGHVYSAVHAIAMEAAAQPVHIGRKEKVKSDEPKRRKPNDKKSAYLKRRMTMTTRAKAASSELEVIDDHPLLDNLEYPNKIQTKWQFTYSFVANLCLTGWSFTVAGKKKAGGYEFYSVPTTWVHPDHEQGAFSRFKIYNPREPNSEDQPWIPGNQVGIAFFPNPADPLSALAPAAAQYPAIKIDDYIQSSQRIFFDNGIFPSVVVTVGSNPHPDIPAGVRPRLTAPQRRQVYAAIKKTVGGIANYGNPAIVDGLIEKIEKLSMTQNEMGWEKSEKVVRSRILSAFGVHPFILGEEMAGSYAQAFIVQERFFKRVNTFLDMLSVMMTGFIGEGELIEEEDDLLIWWDECKATDPSMEKTMWEQARARDDVDQNEFRAFMGLPPDEDEKEAVINKTLIQHVSKIAADATAGTITVEQAVAMLTGLGLPEEMAEEIAGEGPPEPDPNAMPGMPGVPGQPGVPGLPPQPGVPQAGGKPPTPGQPIAGAVKPAKPKKPKPPKPEQALADATDALKKATDALVSDPEDVLRDLMDRSSLVESTE